MANWTVIWPAGAADAEWLEDLEPAALPPVRGTPVAPDQVRAALTDLGWAFSETADEHDGVPVARFSAELRDGVWPPFSEVEVWPDQLSVRQGGCAAYLLAVRACRTCGPLLALDMGGAGPVLVTPDLTWEKFASAFA